MNDVLPVIDVATVDVRVGLVIAQAVGYSTGHRPGPHYRIEGKLIFDTRAECGGNHIKQTADDGSSRRQTGDSGCLSGDFPAYFC